MKDSIPTSLRSRVVQKFSCTDCGACYVGETNWHLATRIREYLFTDKNSHISRHLKSSENCRALHSENCFFILDTASTHFQLKIKGRCIFIWKNRHTIGNAGYMHWLRIWIGHVIALFASVVIGQSNYFGFDFTTLIDNRSANYGMSVQIVVRSICVNTIFRNKTLL